MFPSRNRDKFLCGLFLDLVKAEPGMCESGYIDALVVATGYRRHHRLLLGKERAEFVKLCESSPLSTSQSVQFPWGDMKTLMLLREAIEIDAATVAPGPFLSAARISYPRADKRLVALLAKAAATLRNMQEEAALRLRG